MNKGFNRIAMIDKLANGDITKYETVQDIRYIEAMNHLQFLKAKDEYQEKVRAIEAARNNH